MPYESFKLRPREQFRKSRLFTAWTLKFNSKNEIIVEGILECGLRGRTKPIATRLSSSKILSKFKHTYHLVGNLADPNYELPGFVRHRFYTGFPEDWEIVVGIWKKFVAPETNVKITLPCSSETWVVEKRLKLSIDGCADSYDFTEYAKKVTRVENVDLRKLTAWTPLVLSDQTSRLYLAFKGTLLSSMGHAVDKNHVTDAVHQRLSARVIETTNQQLYELLGDLNNTKHDVPKELVTWCRYGCPKQIDLFCKKFRTIRPGKTELLKPSAQKTVLQDPEKSSKEVVCYNRSPDLFKNTRPSSRYQPVKVNNKRKRMLMELDDDFSDSAGSGSNMACNKKADVIRKKNPLIKGQPQVIATTPTNLAVTYSRDSTIAEGHGFRTDEEDRPNNVDGEDEPNVTQLCSHEKYKQGSAFGKVPHLSYIFHQCAPPTENILSDGV